MNPKFTADGPVRLIRARKVNKEKAIQEKYAAELAVGGPMKKLKLHAQMLAEKFAASKDHKPHEPSAGTLW